MAKIGRNTPCPCGSGKKYKRCCEQKEAEMRRRELPSGRFRYESGSYGGTGGGYMPSIIGYKDVGGNSWKEHLCLVKPDTVLEDEDATSAISEKHLATAREIHDEGGTLQDFALSLRHEGYKSLSDFRVVNDE
jgi:hypothetical protein